VSPYIYTSKNSLLRAAPAKSFEENSNQELLTNTENNANNNSNCKASNGIADWIIAILCVLAAVIIIQMMFIVALTSKRNSVSNNKKVLVEE